MAKKDAVEAKTNNHKAKAVITPAEELPGKTTVTVTAEDTEVTKTYTITFTIASGAPKVTDAKWKDMVGTPVIDQIKKTITGRIANGSDLTAIVVDFAGQNIETWADKGDPQDFSNGPVEFIFSSPFGPMETYSVSITEAPLMSSDATLSSLTYGDNSVPGFAPDKYDYTIKLTAGIKTPPVIAAKANDSNAEVKIDQAQSVPGVGKVTVTAQDGTTIVYVLNFEYANWTASSIVDTDDYLLIYVGGGDYKAVTIGVGIQVAIYDYAGRLLKLETIEQADPADVEVEVTEGGNQILRKAFPSATGVVFHAAPSQPYFYVFFDSKTKKIAKGGKFEYVY
jgi:hypothetical protein